MSAQDDELPKGTEEAPETGGVPDKVTDGDSIFNRLKHPVTTSGDSADDSGVTAGGPTLHQGADDGPERLSTPPNQTDSANLPSHTSVQPPPPGGGLGARPPGSVGVSGGHAEELDERAARRAERLIAFWFTLSVVGTFGFIVTNFVGDKHAEYYTPCLGAAMGLALGGLGIGLILWAKRLMPHLQAEQPRHDFTSPQDEIAATEETFAQGFADTGLAKRPLLRRTLLGAGTALGGLVVVPLLNLTNAKPGKALDRTQWVKGARLITGEGNFVKLGDVSIGSIETVFPAVPTPLPDGTLDYPETGFKVDLHSKADSTTILIRLAPGENRPRPGREDWAVADHVAYSKICTHAGCPVSLYEQQTHHLLCPCHQSVFDVLDGCRAIFGPASRSLPQLAIAVDDEGYLYARDGDYTEPVGAAFWERS